MSAGERERENLLSRQEFERSGQSPFVFHHAMALGADPIAGDAVFDRFDMRCLSVGDSHRLHHGLQWIAVRWLHFNIRQFPKMCVHAAGGSLANVEFVPAPDDERDEPAGG